MNEKIKRTRRLRGNEILRRMTRETRISADSLVYPLFVRDGKGIAEDLPSLPGQVRYSPDTIQWGVGEALDLGVRSFILFGVPLEKDDAGTGAYDGDGVIQMALANVKSEYGAKVQLITDVCLCEYTSHGHCGLLRDADVDNDATLPLLGRTALSHARAGCDVVAPSGMMDGAVGAIRESLDAGGYQYMPIMSYAAKYASAFYGPFREAAGSTPAFGDRKSYQMDFHNGREALKRICADVDEDADIIIVKPALSYLDIISRARETVFEPIAAYSVSGEYAMIKAAGSAGLIDEYKIMCESAACIFRAGADILITYYAKELAEAIKKGDVG